VFAISTNEENYYGHHDTLENAIDEAVNEYGYESFWVGECVDPVQPEELFEVRQWLELVSESEDYEGEWAEDWNQSTPLQRQELETKVRAVMAEWLDRYKLRPGFFKITNPVKYVVVDGVPVSASTVEA